MPAFPEPNNRRHKAAIESLSSVGAVTVTTAGVVNSTAFGGRTGDVLEGSPYVTPSADVSAVLSEGDWLRLCDATDGLVRTSVANARLGLLGVEGCAGAERPIEVFTRRTVASPHYNSKLW